MINKAQAVTKKIGFLVGIICLILTAPNLFASTYIAIEDVLVYDLLNRLEAEGVVQSGLLNTKPISRIEAHRLLQEAERASVDRDEHIKFLVRSLKERLGPAPSETRFKALDQIYARYVYTNAEVHTLQYKKSIQNQQPFNYNNNGDLYERGSNARLGFTSRLDDWGPLSLEVNPEFQYPESPWTEDEVVTKKAYAVLDLRGWNLVLGQDSQWWGPGYHGAILLSNNAEPFTMVKIANSSPVRLPWIFDSLGPFGFTFFVTNLEKAREIPEPYLYGMRFGLKPHPNVEIGLQKTAFIGGRKGRKEDLDTWVDSLLPFSDAENQGGNDQVGDQRAGLDFKINLPSDFQPVQIYLEAVGEDEKNNLPNVWAFVGGIYLPRILDYERVDFRLEFATTRGRHLTPYNWYTHHIYSGYTYNGNVIGHHVGTNSNDIFVETTYLMTEPKAKLCLSYNREEHNLYIPGSHEVLHEVTTGGTFFLSKRVEADASFSYGRLRNKGNVPEESKNLGIIQCEFRYFF